MHHKGHRVVSILFGLLIQCGGDSGSGDDTNNCIPGELDCECNQGQCLSGLACNGGTCVVDATTSDSTASDMSTDASTEAGTDVSTSITADTSSNETDASCEPPNILCEGECINPLGDPENCGECGKVCNTVLDSGGCVQGACRPVWSGCVDASNLILCPEVCQAQGFLGCSTAACGDENMSVWWFGISIDCESGTFSPESEANACETEPTGMNSEYYRCCCDQN